MIVLCATWERIKFLDFQLNFSRSLLISFSSHALHGFGFLSFQFFFPFPFRFQRVLHTSSFFLIFFHLSLQLVLVLFRCFIIFQCRMLVSSLSFCFLCCFIDWRSRTYVRWETMKMVKMGQCVQRLNVLLSFLTFSIRWIFVGRK